MIGPVIDSGALAIGGILGVVFGRWLPARVKETLPLIFGVITISLGATLVGAAAYVHVVVLALILGSFLGELLYLERCLTFIIKKSIQWSHRHGKPADDNFIINYITLISAFCFGSMGLFGAVNEGITGQPDILLTKAVLDLFTGLIFGAGMGIMVSFIAVPQFIILAALYYSAAFVMPIMSESMLNDFTSCGGIIFLATGLRMCGIKIFPIINMLPSIFLVLPLSFGWSLLGWH